MYIFFFYALLFIIYSMIGWIIEVTYVYIIDKTLVNRGFLIGPYIPIYGTCALIITTLLTPLKNNPILLIILSMLICSLTEYITSFIQEKIFNARWWDYSKKKFNLNGRICLLNTTLFGILAILLIYIVNPFITNILTDMNKKYLEIISITYSLIFIIDFIISIKFALNLKSKFSNFKNDATIEIKKLIKETLKSNYISKRFYKAFPNLKINIKK